MRFQAGAWEREANHSLSHRKRGERVGVRGATYDVSAIMKNYIKFIKPRPQGQGFLDEAKIVSLAKLLMLRYISLT